MGWKMMMLSFMLVEKMDCSVKAKEFDTIYVNGDNNLDNLRKDEDHYKVKLIEQEFKKLMFGE